LDFYTFEKLTANLNPMKAIYLLCFCAFFLFSCAYLPESLKPLKKQKSEKSVTGTWELLSFKGIDPSGRIQYPYGKQVKGIAFFTDELEFSMQFYDATRPRQSTSDPFFCSDPEIRISYLTARSCFGSYSMSDDSITFSIEAANLPNLSGVNEKRYFKMYGDTMLLISPIRRLNGVFLSEHTIWVNKGKSTKETLQPRWFYYQPRD
jgi:hypothetical protein